MKSLSAIVFICAFSCAEANVSSFEVVPRNTDPAIGAAFNSPHTTYVNRDIVIEKAPQSSQDRHELLVFLPGTNGKADGAKAFCELAAELGYHVVNLMYPDDIAASICAGDNKPKAFEEFRMALIAGGQSKYISITRADSIENRLAKLLRYLHANHADEGWNQFSNEDGTVKWSTIAVAGQSQGGGHAALIGIKHRVTRVVSTGAPKDFSKKLDAPAAWYALESATPKACFFTFNHVQDPKGCTPKQLQMNLTALKLDAFGPPVDVTQKDSPYLHTRILMTSYPAVAVEGPNSKGAKIAHTSVIASSNASRWQKVWTYMLTETVP
jgi:hypothetical protein